MSVAIETHTGWAMRMHADTPHCGTQDKRCVYKTTSKTSVYSAPRPGARAPPCTHPALSRVVCAGSRPRSIEPAQELVHERGTVAAGVEGERGEEPGAHLVHLRHGVRAHLPTMAGPRGRSHSLLVAYWLVSRRIRLAADQSMRAPRSDRFISVHDPPVCSVCVGEATSALAGNAFVRSFALSSLADRMFSCVFCRAAVFCFVSDPKQGSGTQAPTPSANIPRTPLCASSSMSGTMLNQLGCGISQFRSLK